MARTCNFHLSSIGRLLLWLGLFFCLAVPAVHASSPEKVVIACSEETAPFHFVDEEGHPAGMFIDLWKLWSEKTGIAVEFRCVSWPETLEMMREGRADIHAGLFYTAERDGYVDYASSLLEIDTHFFHHRSIFGLNRLEDLVGFRIGLIEGDYAVDFVRQELPGASLAIYPNYDALFEAAERGEIRVFIVDTLTGLHHMVKKNIRQNYSFKVGAPLYRRNFFSAAAEADLATVERVKEGMELIGREERAAIERKWLEAASKKTPEVLVVAISYSYRPFSRLDAEGRAAGVLVDLWRLWAQKTGQKVEFLVTDWRGTLEAMKEGDADIHSGLFRTEERQRWLDFTQPFYQTSSHIFYPLRLGSLTRLEELYGRKVGVIGGAYQGDYLRKNFPRMEVVGFPSDEAMVRAAMKGEISAFLEETPVALTVLNRMGEQGVFGQLGAPLFKERIHGAVRKGNSELLSLLDRGLSLIGREELAEIEERWVKIPEMRQMDKPLLRLTAEEEAWLESHREFRLGVDPTWPPFEFYDEEGVYRGIIADYVELLGGRLEVSMAPVKGLSWGQTLEKTRAGQIDLLPAVNRSPEREEFLEFTSPYLSFPFVVVTMDDAPFIADLRDLEGKRVAVGKDYVVQALLEGDFPEIDLLPVEDVLGGLKAVSTGRAYGFIGNLAAVGYAIKKEGLTNLKVAGTTPYSSDLSLAVRKDLKPLAPILDKALQALSESEKSRIYDKWVRIRFEQEVDWGYLWRRILLVAGISSVILTIVVIWNRRLAREIGERKRAERGLRAARDEAEEANRAKSVFLANMSHELRTPLNAILGFTQLMDRDPGASHIQREHLGIVNRSGAHLLGLINDVLDMSKVEAGQLSLTTGSFDLSGTLAALMEMVRPRAEVKGLRLLLDSPSDLPRYLKADERKLRQVLLNLLGNAVKFTLEGGVSLRVGEVGEGRLRFEVEDSGPGIAPEEMGRLFEPFVQTETGQKAKEGTGLGLAISRRFVQLMGGEIEAESELGRGTRFHFEIAFEAADPSEIESARTLRRVVGLEAGQPSYRILVADDRQESRLLLQRLLEPIGFEVRTAADGVEATEMNGAWKPQFIWMDMRMPVMDGYEATRRIKAEVEAPVIVALSASVFEEDREHVLSCGCDDFIRKPYRESEIFEAMGRHLGVRYLYEEEEGAVSDGEKVAALPLESLASLPGALAEELEMAVTSLDIMAIAEVVDRIGEVDAKLGEALAELARRYRYDRILDLLGKK